MNHGLTNLIQIKNKTVLKKEKIASLVQIKFLQVNFWR